ncbi:ParB/RepB/Spo0J family partition protein [Thiomicrorhabdus arctica]|uniref:ParB/RepB/Spo0J family partition protein n=1 Tax=Thiomicrorhabdus arctica TaxID=131540 RepID=UPI0003AA9439|nr:ParB/RepB/Spo0J family partition protein [Thiomicrorhabdus arctica]
MVKKRSGMGKLGIHAMIGAKQKVENSSADLRIEKVSLSQLQPGQFQPRQQFNDDSLQELADSIKVQGIVQPIIVRPIGADKYEIIAGERRWRASKLAGLDKVPVVIRQADSQATLAMALIENIQREDLNPIETAIGLQRLLKEFDLTQQAVADAVGRSRAAVSNLLRLLKLPKNIQNNLHDGLLSMGHARAIISLPEVVQEDLANKAIDKGWSVREIEEAAQQFLVPKKLVNEAKKKAVPGFDEVMSKQDELAVRLSAPVKINHRENGRGKIEISYQDMAELNRLLNLF